jgi:hypothetical protein
MAVTRVVRRGALALAGALVALGGRPAAAQDQPSPPDARPWFVAAAKWVKWPTLAAAVGLTAIAIMRKADADDSYDQLQARCLDEPEDCAIDPNGAYANPEAESLYQETLRLDAQARNWMIGGQGFLVVSGGLFLIDLVAGSRKPENIPFTPLEAYTAPGTLGVRWRF